MVEPRLTRTYYTTAQSIFPDVRSPYPSHNITKNWHFGDFINDSLQKQTAAISKSFSKNGQCAQKKKSFFPLLAQSRSWNVSIPWPHEGWGQNTNPEYQLKPWVSASRVATSQLKEPRVRLIHGVWIDTRGSYCPHPELGIFFFSPYTLSILIEETHILINTAAKKWSK